jgi:hypothetical protein
MTGLSLNLGLGLSRPVSGSSFDGIDYTSPVYQGNLNLGAGSSISNTREGVCCNNDASKVWVYYVDVLAQFSWDGSSGTMTFDGEINIQTELGSAVGLVAGLWYNPNKRELLIYESGGDNIITVAATSDDNFVSSVTVSSVSGPTSASLDGWGLGAAKDQLVMTLDAGSTFDIRGWDLPSNDFSSFGTERTFTDATNGSGRGKGCVFANSGNTLLGLDDAKQLLVYNTTEAYKAFDGSGNSLLTYQGKSTLSNLLIEDCMTISGDGQTLLFGDFSTYVRYYTPS